MHHFPVVLDLANLGRLIVVRRHIMPLLAVCLLFISGGVFAQEELSLFDGNGRASAYIVADSDLTIYLWSGEPVAYLVRDGGGGFHVYGFNGKHLGWFVRGIIRDHEGDAACALKGLIFNPQFEPLKSLKSLKSFKSFRQFAPFRPLFWNRWGELPCRFFLSQGK